MSKKALYRHKRTGDLFTIDTNDIDKVIVKVINHYGDEVLKVGEITAAISRR